MSHNELPAKLRRHPPTHGAKLDNVRTLMRHPQPASGLDQKRGIPGLIEKRIPGDYSAQPEIQGKHTTEDIRLHPFVKQLLLEARRSDRTKSPLSIVLFRIDGAGRPELGKIRRFYELIYRKCRETDVPARIGEHLIAILLLDTNADGAEVFTRRMLGHAKELAVSTIAQTYPDHLFDNFVSGIEDPSDPFPFVPDNSTAKGRQQFIPAALSVAKEGWSGLLRVVNRPWYD